MAFISWPKGQRIEIISRPEDQTFPRMKNNFNSLADHSQ